MVLHFFYYLKLPVLLKSKGDNIKRKTLNGCGCLENEGNPWIYIKINIDMIVFIYLI